MLIQYFFGHLCMIPNECFDKIYLLTHFQVASNLVSKTSYLNKNTYINIFFIEN